MESHFSWDIISKTTAVKHLDRSTFVHWGTGIPAAEIVWFFDIGEDGPASEHQVLIHQGKEYDVRIHLWIMREVSRLFWKCRFHRPDTVQASHFFKIHQDGETPNQNAWLRFTKLGDNRYEVSFSTEKAENEVKPVSRSSTQDSEIRYQSADTGHLFQTKVWTDVYGVIERKMN